MAKLRRVLVLAALALLLYDVAARSVRAEGRARRFAVLDAEAFRSRFGDDAEWALSNVPLFDCPDAEICQTYDFRWRIFKKHIRSTPDGWVITEFLPDVAWAGKHNTISCAAGHHIREGRWLADPRPIRDYVRFWFRKGGEPRRYSFWAAESVEALALATGDWSLGVELLPDLVANFDEWERTHRDPNGLFWQIDDRDGMEYSIGGSGYRPTINSYMFGDANAIARFAVRAGQSDLAERFYRTADKLRDLFQATLWDARARFFKTRPRGSQTNLVEVREEIGFVPWYFNLPAPGYEGAGRSSLTHRASPRPLARRPPSGAALGSSSAITTNASGMGHRGRSPRHRHWSRWPTCSTTRGSSRLWAKPTIWPC